MCGIHCYFGKTEGKLEIVLAQSNKIKHRGGDENNYFMNDKCIMCHERLSITGINDGLQPLFSEDKSIVLVMNGEIYNHKELRTKYFSNEVFMSHSDCEIFIHLYKKFGKDFLMRNEVYGMFGFVLYDIVNDITIIGRDHVGIIPLYYGKDAEDNIYVSSEMKTFSDIGVMIQQFPPGCYSNLSFDMEVWFIPQWKTDPNYMPSCDFDNEEFKAILTDVVRNYLDTEAPYGVLLSGGLDSSLIASIASKIHREKGLGKVKTFCIGLKDSPDLKAAETVAYYIDSEHYSFEYGIGEGLISLEDVIYHIETYDTTTIRASTPMYLMAKRMHDMGIKMVLTGEGIDEVMAGYAYFKYAPSKEELHKEVVRKVLDLYKYDLLRANKSLMAFHIEGRVPYLDIRVLNYLMNISPESKMWDGVNINEKWLIRSAFDNGRYLPKSIITRKKEQFSDGVGHKWINSIKDYSSNVMEEEKYYEFNQSVVLPDTDEEKLYRFLFEKSFKSDACLKTFNFVKSIACSSEIALQWMSGLPQDPSGRTTDRNGRSVYI